MTIQFEMTVKDFREAHSLATSTHPSARLQRVLRTALPVLGAVLILAYLTSAFLKNQFVEVSLRPAFFLGIGLLALPLFVRLGQTRAFNRSFPEKNSPRVITVTFEESGVNWGIPGVAESHWGWSAIKSFVEGKSVALIYVAQVNFLTLPKRVVSEQELSQIRSLFMEHQIKAVQR